MTERYYIAMKAVGHADRRRWVYIVKDLHTHIYVHPGFTERLIEAHSFDSYEAAERYREMYVQNKSYSARTIEDMQMEEIMEAIT